MDAKGATELRREAAKRSRPARLFGAQGLPWHAVSEHPLARQLSVRSLRRQGPCASRVRWCCLCGLALQQTPRQRADHHPRRLSRKSLSGGAHVVSAKFRELPDTVGDVGVLGLTAGWGMSPTAPAVQDVPRSCHYRAVGMACSFLPCEAVFIGTAGRLQAGMQITFGFASKEHACIAAYSSSATGEGASEKASGLQPLDPKRALLLQPFCGEECQGCLWFWEPGCLGDAGLLERMARPALALPCISPIARCRSLTPKSGIRFAGRTLEHPQTHWPLLN